MLFFSFCGTTLVCVTRGLRSNVPCSCIGEYTIPLASLKLIIRGYFLYILCLIHFFCTLTCFGYYHSTHSWPLCMSLMFSFNLILSYLYCGFLGIHKQVIFEQRFIMAPSIDFPISRPQTLNEHPVPLPPWIGTLTFTNGPHLSKNTSFGVRCAPT